MKESGMDKLIELLNEYIEEKELGNTVKEIDDDYFVNNYNNWDGYLCEEVISKKFGFIKRLVENDKIDLSSRNALFISEDAENGEKQRPYSFYEEMLIRLSISDTPIEDLISYLKIS